MTYPVDEPVWPDPEEWPMRYWPTLTAALGCVQCGKLFRHSVLCPFCGSDAVLNLGKILKERDQNVCDDGSGDASTGGE